MCHVCLLLFLFSLPIFDATPTTAVVGCSNIASMQCVICVCSLFSPALLLFFPSDMCAAHFDEFFFLKNDYFSLFSPSLAVTTCANITIMSCVVCDYFNLCIFLFQLLHFAILPLFPCHVAIAPCPNIAGRSCVVCDCFNYICTLIFWVNISLFLDATSSSQHAQTSQECRASYAIVPISMIVRCCIFVSIFTILQQPPSLSRADELVCRLLFPSRFCM